MRVITAVKGELKECDWPEPEPREHDLLVRVRAVSVNPVDTKVRQRGQSSDEQKILGWDAVGEVVATGSQSSQFKPGDRVWYAGDVTRPGSNAELQCVDERIVALAPKTLSDTEAAALPLTAITAWELLFERLQMPRDESGTERILLITGAAGGVGSILTQLARQLTQATIVATASRDESAEWATELGAHYVLDHSLPLAAELEKHNIASVTDVASLTHTGAHFNELVKMLRPQGRLALIDDPSEPLDIGAMKQKSLSLHWEFMFTRSMFKTDDMIRQHALLKEVAALVDDGTLKTTLKHHMGVLSVPTLERAHQTIQAGRTIGKIVLSGY